MNADVWMVEQQPGYTSVSSIGCQNERSVSIVALGIHICSSIDQHFSYSCATSTEESQLTILHRWNLSREKPLQIGEITMDYNTSANIK